MAQQGQSSSNKGNPAHKRMGNAALKARRVASRLRGDQRRADRRAAQDARATFNRELRQLGELPTPWESATRKRRAARVARFGVATWVPEDLDRDDGVDRNGSRR